MTETRVTCDKCGHTSERVRAGVPHVSTNGEPCGGIMRAPDILAQLDALLAEASPLPWVVHLPGSGRVCDDQHDTEDGCKVVMFAELLYGMMAHAAHNARLTALATAHLRPLVAAALWASNEDNHAGWCGEQGNLCPPCAALANLAAALDGGEKEAEG